MPVRIMDYRYMYTFGTFEEGHLLRARIVQAHDKSPLSWLSLFLACLGQASSCVRKLIVALVTLSLVSLLEARA